MVHRDRSADVASRGRAQEPTLIRVNAFPNAKALPRQPGSLRASSRRTAFAIAARAHARTREGQREGLAAGNFDIAQSALDNAVAMIEVAKHDVGIDGGGEAG